MKQLSDIPPLPADISRFARLFDHSILRPDATRDDVARFAEAAARLQTATLMVQPHYITFALELLSGSGVPVAAVIAFPHGNETQSMKRSLALEALSLGATELDMVMNIPALKGGEQELFMRDIEGVVNAAKGKTVKVITENCYLTQPEKVRACEWIALTGAQFVKTSTGFAASGATVEDVRLMHQAVQGICEVKAAGGITAIDQVVALLAAGATRIGSSRTEQLIRDFQDLRPEQKLILSKPRS
ncbi:MAG: deoxyribose-phosphate aldolase [Gemmatimonadota bacterium]